MLHLRCPTRSDFALHEGGCRPAIRCKLPAPRINNDERGTSPVAKPGDPDSDPQPREDATVLSNNKPAPPPPLPQMNVTVQQGPVPTPYRPDSTVLSNPPP